MKELIQEIVDVDRAAQAEIAEAKKQRLEIGDTVKKEVELLKEKYIAQAKQEISKQRLAAEEKESAKWKAKLRYYHDLKQKLDAVYEKNKETWVSDIVTRVLGK